MDLSPESLLQRSLLASLLTRPELFPLLEHFGLSPLLLDAFAIVADCRLWRRWRWPFGSDRERCR